MKLAVVCATARANALVKTKQSIAAQTRQPDACYLVGEDDWEWWTQVPFVEPTWYAPEMAINAVFDAAFDGGADVAVYVSDLAWYDSNALATIEQYMAEHPEAPMLSSVHCFHVEENKCGAPAPDVGTCAKWCGYDRTKENTTPVENDRIYRNLKMLEEKGYVAGPVPANLHLLSHTAVRRDVWRKMNGLDERFTGASGYIDTNFAQRVEAAFELCHIHTGLREHRMDYRAGAREMVSKPRYFPYARNEWLCCHLRETEVAKGEYRAVRLYDDVRPLPPLAWCWGQYVR